MELEPWATDRVSESGTTGADSAFPKSRPLWQPPASLGTSRIDSTPRSCWVAMKVMMMIARIANLAVPIALECAILIFTTISDVDFLFDPSLIFLFCSWCPSFDSKLGMINLANSLNSMQVSRTSPVDPDRSLRRYGIYVKIDCAALIFFLPKREYWTLSGSFKLKMPSCQMRLESQH